MYQLPQSTTNAITYFVDIIEVVILWNQKLKISMVFKEDMHKLRTSYSMA